MTKRLKYLLAQAEERGVKPPLQKTLDKYGLTQEDWLELLATQGWMCPICEKPERLWNTDHEHVSGWVKLDAGDRKRYVRGVLCWFCNHKRVHSQYGPGEADRIAAYIRRYEERRDA